MWNKPTPEELRQLSALYETGDIVAEDRIIGMHFRAGGSDWSAVEYDREDIFFGFVIINNDEENTEWGYSSFTELAEIHFLGFQDRPRALEARAGW